MDKTELTPLEWYSKVSETLRLFFYNLRNGTQPTEKQWETIKAIFPVYYNGDLTITKDVKQTTEEILSQGLLFGADGHDKVTDKPPKPLKAQ